VIFTFVAKVGSHNSEFLAYINSSQSTLSKHAIQLADLGKTRPRPQTQGHRPQTTGPAPQLLPLVGMISLFENGPKNTRPGSQGNGQISNCPKLVGPIRPCWAQCDEGSPHTSPLIFHANLPAFVPR